VDCAVKVKHWPIVLLASPVTDTSLPSVSTNYLMTLLWFRPSTLPTPDSSCQHEQFILRRFVILPTSQNHSFHTELDWVYVHMDLNPVVGPVVLTPSPGQWFNTNLDPLHWLLLALASCIRQGLRNCPSGEMRIQGHSTILGLDARYDLDVSFLRR
jgi:hypothetical protein